MAAFESFDEPTLRAICNTLGDTDAGLTGSEIGQLLSASNIEDVDRSYDDQKNTPLRSIEPQASNR